MDNGRNRGKFSEGGRMGFEPIENVGLASKESAQEILKIFNQVHEPRVVRSLSSSHSNGPVPIHLSTCAYLIGQRKSYMGGTGRPARPSSLRCG